MYPLNESLILRGRVVNRFLQDCGNQTTDELRILTTQAYSPGREQLSASFTFYAYTFLRILTYTSG